MTTEDKEATVHREVRDIGLTFPIVTVGFGSSAVFRWRRVWAKPCCWATFWRAVLAPASRSVEGHRTPDAALVC